MELQSMYVHNKELKYVVLRQYKLCIVTAQSEYTPVSTLIALSVQVEYRILSSF